MMSSKMQTKTFRMNPSKQDMLKHQCNLIQHLPLIKDRICAYKVTGIKVLLFVRGCPGSGKTTNAKSILQYCGIETPNQNLFSSDDFFTKEPYKIVTLDLLDEARQWNEARVSKAIKNHVTPLVVDDCFLKKVSLKTFYEYAAKNGYLVEILEPAEPLSWDPNILITRTHIPITYDVLKETTEEYEYIISAQHLFKYFKMQYIPGMYPPQKADTVQNDLNGSKESLSESDSTSKPPSPILNGKSPTSIDQSSNCKELTRRFSNTGWRHSDELCGSKENLLESNSTSKSSSPLPDGNNHTNSEPSPHFNKLTRRCFDFKNDRRQPELFSNQNGSELHKSARHFENELTTVSIPKDTVLQLQSVFGGYLAPGMLDDKNMISLPYGLARQLHSYVMESVEEDMFQKEQSLAKDIEADLQERENAKRGLKGTTFNVSNLLEEELDKFCKAMKNGTSPSKVTAKLPLKLLYERFPDADSELIWELLECVNKCLRKAAALISTLPDPDTLPLMKDWEASEENRKEAIDQALAYKNVATAFYEEINVYSEKAKAAFTEGQRSLANFYYEIGKWHKKLIEKVNIFAAKVLLKENEQSDTLDLHFLSVKDGIHILDLFLDANVRRLNNSDDKSRFLFIITGSGARSKFGNVLKYNVKKHLAARNIQYWQMNPGMFKLCIKSTSIFSCEL